MATLTVAQIQFIQTGSAMATVAYGTGLPPAGFTLLADSSGVFKPVINSTSGFSAQTYVE